MGIHQLIQFVQKCCFPAMVLIIMYRIRMKEKKIEMLRINPKLKVLFIPHSKSCSTV